MDILQIVAFGAIGLFAGLVGGMLGVGGSIIMIPAMTEVLGPDQHLYQAAAMIVNFFVVVPAVYQHFRAKAVDRATITRIIPLAAAAVLVGVAASELPVFAGEGEAYLRGLFGLFLLSVALTDLHRFLRRRKSAGRTTGESAACTASKTDTSTEVDLNGGVGWWRVAAVAVPTGIIAGLLGVGGGVLAVPLQRKLLRIPLRSAIANSATIIIATSLFGAVAKNYAFFVDHDHSVDSFVLAAALIPTAIVGSLGGSRLTHRLPLKIVRAAFFALLLVAALRLMYSAGRSLRIPEEPLTVNQRAEKVCGTGFPACRACSQPAENRLESRSHIQMSHIQIESFNSLLAVAQLLRPMYAPSVSSQPNRPKRAQLFEPCSPIRSSGNVR